MSNTDRPQSSIFSRLIGVCGILLTHSMAMLFVMFALVKIVPAYAVVFEQEEMALPLATQRIVAWSEYWVAYWFIFFFLGMFIDTAIVLFLGVVPKSPRAVSAYSHVVLLFAFALVVYVAAWLTHPVYSLVQ